MSKYSSSEFVELSLDSSASCTVPRQAISNVSKIDISIPTNSSFLDKNQLSMSSVPAEIAIEIVKRFLAGGK